jgi:Ca2+-binding RTX toxin-like protein
VLAASLAGTATPAEAAVASANVDDLTATLNLDDADDNVTVSVAGGLLVHGQTTGGLNSGTDWDSDDAGDQTVPADGTFTVIVNGGSGNDAITVLAKTTELARSRLNGDGGDDVLTGADSDETLNGGEGDDRLVAGRGNDAMNGGAGNDTLVWNQGDGSDRASGEAGNDVSEVNGAPTLGDVFILDPVIGGTVKLRRTNLGQFTFDAATERFEVNGLGGADSVTANNGVGAFTQLALDGGAGTDTINGSEGPDLILGGDANDALTGGGGDDRIVGDRGTDTMNGGDGDDVLVWNNGDGTDVGNGDQGRDDLEVNGAQAAGDAFMVQSNGARIQFTRTNLVPFAIDLGSSETLHVNGLGGDDTITVDEIGSHALTAAGGPGNDTLTGGDATETFLGGSGADTINAGAGLDLVFGEDGDDRVDVRDRTADVAFGGDGNDSVVADAGRRDTLDGFEAVDRTPNVTPPPSSDSTTRPLNIKGGRVKVKRGTASIEVRCPADSPRNCAGSLAVRTAKRVEFKGVNVTLQLGHARYHLAPGASKTLQVGLAKGSRGLADRRGGLTVLATASTGPQGKIARSSRRFDLVFGSATTRG